MGKWDRSFVPTGSYRIGLIFVSGSALREEPCTDPYARFCGQTGAAIPSDPIAMPSVAECWGSYLTPTYGLYERYGSGSVLYGS